MKDVLNWLSGRKTYILSVVIVAYAIAAYLGYLPEPDKLGAALVIIAGYAITFRSAIASLLKGLAEEPKE